MIYLLRKNWLLYKKNIVLGVLFATFFSIITIDGAKYYTVSLMMCPSLMFSWTVGKICYMEDSNATRQFLLSLPVSKKDIINEKNILSFFCILGGILIANVGSILVGVARDQSVHIDWRINIIMIIFLMFYNTIYIFIYYWYDYSKVRFVPYIILVFMFIFFKFGNETITVVNNAPNIIFIGFLVCALFLNYFVLRIAIKREL